jgi:hypothetical protein
MANVVIDYFQTSFEEHVAYWSELFVKDHVDGKDDRR